MFISKRQLTGIYDTLNNIRCEISDLRTVDRALGTDILDLATDMDKVHKAAHISVPALDRQNHTPVKYILSILLNKLGFVLVRPDDVITISSPEDRKGDE